MTHIIASPSRNLRGGDAIVKKSCDNIRGMTYITKIVLSGIAHYRLSTSSVDISVECL